MEITKELSLSQLTLRRGLPLASYTVTSHLSRPLCSFVHLTFFFIAGVSDSLTNYLVGRIKSSTPCVIKYVPYGALVEVSLRVAS